MHLAVNQGQTVVRWGDEVSGPAIKLWVDRSDCGKFVCVFALHEVSSDMNDVHLHVLQTDSYKSVCGYRL